MSSRSCWGVVLLLVGCEPVRNQDNAPKSGEVIRAPRYALVAEGTPLLQAGADCTTVGPAGCQSGLCVKRGRERLAPRFCADACKQDADCGGGDLCVQISQADNLWACLPPTPTNNETGTAPP